MKTGENICVNPKGGIKICLSREVSVVRFCKVLHQGKTIQLR